jgi:hypothetical protein
MRKKESQGGRRDFGVESRGGVEEKAKMGVVCPR